MKVAFLILFSLFLNASSAQILTGASIRYDNSFGEWLLYTDIDGEEGTLEAPWHRQNRWTDWNFGIRNKNGTVRAVWPNGNCVPMAKPLQCVKFGKMMPMNGVSMMEILR
jgi:hypothetical protein